jgi:hypothetical protein
LLCDSREMGKFSDDCAMVVTMKSELVAVVANDCKDGQLQMGWNIPSARYSNAVPSHGKSFIGKSFIAVPDEFRQLCAC